MDFVDVVEDKLKVEDITNMVSSETCGAISMFVGTTRDNFDGKRVVRLDYEAYMPMAKRKMLEVCAAIREKWDIHNIAIIHRIGVVPVKEASIVIAISSAHRQESLEAVHYAIDTVKATVPIWKKEVYEDDSSSWKQNKECTWSHELPSSSKINESTSTTQLCWQSGQKGVDTSLDKSTQQSHSPSNKCIISSSVTEKL
ncbi:unnamed protein product [Lymnaea stagnalis]|uniref:Molybdopterin synthase catalytic subunit n=1 Tax=Lymnaea stagnalis TaxID=6523 RepID=A0AAV2HIK7_LYMST